MSSRLQRLGARLLGHAPVLAPRTAARFEPAARDSSASTLTLENTMQPASTPPASAQREQPSLVQLEKPAVPATPSTSGKTNDDSAAGRAAPDAVARTAAAAMPPLRPEFKPAEPRGRENDPVTAHAIPMSPVVPVAPVSPPATTPDRRQESAVTSRPEKNAPPSPDPKSDAVSKSDLASELRRLREWISETPVAKPAAPPPAKPAPPPSRVLPPVAQPPLSREYPPSDSARASPPPPAPVQIDIGTIIIRATTSESRASRMPGPASRAAGLAQYLARRSAGRP